ncbi:hypothetical protein BPOR_0784g00020 [Botrytis porri]|uniref:Uncharacterized protein n=1 Tax=Botrytis porri TaxID=87229 RepID=A0A4Z1KAH0_9HELO|nr:hypothetical protein BPOR_0784g00020 [Botrytis porri]
MGDEGYQQCLGYFLGCVEETPTHVAGILVPSRVSNQILVYSSPKSGPQGLIRLEDCYLTVQTTNWGQANLSKIKTRKNCDKNKLLRGAGKRIRGAEM